MMCVITSLYVLGAMPPSAEVQILCENVSISWQEPCPRLDALCVASPMIRRTTSAHHGERASCTLVGPWGPLLPWPDKPNPKTPEASGLS